MEIRKASVSDMFGWLIGSFKLVGKHWGTFLLASLFSLLVLFALVLVIVLAVVVLGDPAALAAAGQQPDVQQLAIIYGGAVLFGILLMPPFMAGWFKLCHNLDTGHKAFATDIFSMYPLSGMWIKLIQYSVISMILYIALHAAYIGLCVVLGIGLEDFKTLLLPDPAADPMGVLNLGAGFWIAYFGLILLGTVLQCMFMLGFTQAALTQANAIDSVKDGIAATLKNLGSLLLFMLIMLVVVLAAALVMGLVAGLLIAALSMLNSNLALAIGAVIYLLLILFIYPLMFSFQYLFWRDVLGTGAKAPVVSDSEVLI